MAYKRLLRNVAVLAVLIIPSVSIAADSSLLFGQQHSYSVTLRGDGEAIITARLVITNHTDKPLNKLKFAVPGATATDMVGYQQVITQTPCITTMMYPSPPCVSQEPDYAASAGYYAEGQSTYTKLQIAPVGEGYEATFPTAIAAQKSTALIMSYAAKGYVSNRWWRSEFALQTLKVPERVTLATVAINTDSDMYLEGSTSKVDYQTSTNDTKLQAGASTSAAELSRIVAAIGNDGLVTKTARNLAAGETLIIKGAYADAAWKLHLIRSVWTAIGLVLFVGLVVVAMGLAKKRSKMSAGTSGIKSQSLAGVWAELLAPMAVVAGTSSAIAVAGLSWCVVAYSRSATVPGDSFAAILLTILGLLMYLILTLGPALWIGVSQRNWRAAGFAVVWQVIGLFVLMAVYAVLFQPLGTTPNPLYPVNDSVTGGGSPALEGTRAQ